MSKPTPQISIVIPLYGCASCFEELIRQLEPVLVSNFENYEIIFVDDCSKDNVWELVKKYAKENKSVIGIKLSRNFGQHAAITAGISKSSGGAVVIMDCDLQDPPAEIISLYKKFKEGYAIVYAKRIDKKFSKIRKLFSALFFKIMSTSKINNLNFSNDFTGFSLISKRVAKEFLKFSEVDRQYIFILKWLGFNYSYIEYNHSDRYCGKSSYSFSKLIKAALQGILSQTTIMLKMVVFSGFAIALIGFISAFYFLIIHYLFKPLPGWTSIIALLLTLSGVIIINIGVVGLYISRIFEQVKDRPLFVIDEVTS